MVHALCVLDTYGYKHTLRIRNTYCFSKITMVTRTRLKVELQGQCLLVIMQDKCVLCEAGIIYL